MADLSLLTVEFQLALGYVSSVCLLSWCGWLWCFNCISEPEEAGSVFSATAYESLSMMYFNVRDSLQITKYRVFMGSLFAASSSHVIPNSWLPARSKILCLDSSCVVGYCSDDFVHVYICVHVFNIGLS
ncbi:hypothetical protein Hanom_Chr06g00558231 [Helianthus anomalus]